MKRVALVLAAALLTSAGVYAAENPAMKMEGMKMDQPAPKAAVNKTTGVVKSLDAAKGTVTLAHEPVATLKWPAMTMAFRISPELAKGLQTGQKVEFEFEAQGMSATITKIAAAK
jgi:Cu(I)/Ag(I) efflux system protein CusF